VGAWGCGPVENDDALDLLVELGDAAAEDQPRLMPYGNVEDLLARIHATVSAEDTTRPLAILAGSGLTAGAIPGVNEIVNVIRHRMSTDDAIELDKRLAKTTEPSLKYQEAFTFLSLRHPPELRDRIITLCTLRAYSGPMRIIQNPTWLRKRTDCARRHKPHDKCYTDGGSRCGRSASS
jgi:hypothetical protein